MEEIKSFFKKKSTWILAVILLAATFARILLITRIPSFVDNGAVFDDRLLVDYADTLVKGEWLGGYSFVTLAKGISYPVFLAITNFLNISYPKALLGIYILAIILFVLSVRKLVKNKYALSIFYLFLLYSPVMLYFEYATRLYRNAIWAPSVLLVIACLLGLFYSRKNEAIWEPLFWSITAGISFLFFWFNREDSIWLLPLFLGAALVTIISIFLDKEKTAGKIKRIFICVIPLILFVGGTSFLSFINLQKYGVYQINDRTEGPFAETMSLLTKIQTNEEKESAVWVSRDAFIEGMKASPTLKSLEENINWVYDISGWAGEDGEVHGDIVFWAFRQSLVEDGYYESAVKSNELFEKLSKELEEGFANGQLIKKKGLFISKSGDGKTMEDMPLIWEYFQYGFYATSQYGNYDSRIGVMNASDEELAWYGELINTRFIYPGTPEDAEIFTSAKPAVKISNHIIKVYRAVSLPLLFLSLIGYLVIIWQMVKNKFKEEHTTLFIIVTGLFLSFIILLFGVAWFSTWATDRKELFMTLYTGGGVPVIQVFKLLCLYSLGAFVKEKVKKKDISPVNE